MIKSYTEAIKIRNFEDRFNYLKLNGQIGETTFNGHRYLNQRLYKCPEWKEVRRRVIMRDNGCDLAHSDYPIFDKILVHHINPITIADIVERRPCVFDLDNLICVSHQTHNAIHYGDISLLNVSNNSERQPNDTKLW